MKKLLFPLFVALVATLSFSSCEKDPLTDQELTDNIVKYSVYNGVDNDNDAFTATFTASSFTIAYSNTALTFGGTWSVKDGQLLLNDPETEFEAGTINKDGKELIVKSGPMTLTMTAK